jgi:NaMN:DMB phosphoribosyltransferase
VQDTDDSPSAADLPSFAKRITLPDEPAKRDATAALGPYDGALGQLGDLAVWMASVQGKFPAAPPARATLVLIGSDATPPEELALMVDAAVRVVDPAPDDSGAAAAFDAGVSVASAEIDSGADLLMLAGASPRDTAGDSSHPDIAAMVAVALLANKDVASIVGHGPGMDDEAWMRTCAAVRDTARHARPLTGQLIEMLGAIDSPALSMAAGMLVEATARRIPVVLDDLLAAGAALIAQRLSYRTARWLVAAHRNPHPAHEAALERLRLKPLLDYGLTTGNDSRAGVGALLALPHIRAAATLLRPSESDQVTNSTTSA